MKTLASIVYVSAALMLLSCGKRHQKTGTTADSVAKKHEFYADITEDVSIISLIANPKQYHGHKVRVIGYLNLEFEGNGIYLHKEDYDQSISKNGLWIEMSRDSLRSPNMRRYSKNYVLMEGNF